MMFVEVLVEGGSDVPAVKEILQRRFNLIENQHFRIHPHRGKGKLSINPLSRPDPKNRGLLDQLPAKLKGFARTPGSRCVVVLIDADDDDSVELKSNLVALCRSLNPNPSCVLFRIAVEEIESWFIADSAAIKQAYPTAKLTKLPSDPPDSIIGAWECLAAVLGRRPEECVGADKCEWSAHISPYLDLNNPKSPSLNNFVLGINKYIDRIIS